MSWGSRIRRVAFIALALAMTPFAYLNRHDVLVHINPLAMADPERALTIPVFLVILVSVIAGALFGFLMGRWQRHARHRDVSPTPRDKPTVSSD